MPNNLPLKSRKGTGLSGTARRLVFSFQVLGKSQCPRVKQGRPDVEEMSVQQAHDQQGEKGEPDKNNVGIALFPE